MKTPKRDYKAPYAPQRQDVVDCTLESWKRCKDTRWKRKNRTAQLKRTIARLKKEKEEAYHKGHKAGYDLGFSCLMF